MPDSLLGGVRAGAGGRGPAAVPRARAVARELPQAHRLLTDGQLRFVGLVSIVLGLVGFWLVQPCVSGSSPSTSRTCCRREAERIEALRRAAARPLPRARLPAGAAAAGRAPRVAADRHRPRPRPADVQGRRSAVGAPARRARRHHAAGRAHRRAPAERARRHAPVLRGQRAAHRPGRRRARRARSCRSAPSSTASPASPATARSLALLLSSLAAAGVRGLHLDLGHVGVYRALADAAGIAGNGEDSRAVRRAARQGRARRRASSPRGCPPAWRDALTALPTLYGPAQDVLAAARARLPDTPAIANALGALAALAAVGAAAGRRAARRSRRPHRLSLPERRDLLGVHRRRDRTRSATAAATTASARRSAARVRPPASRSTCASSPA